MIILALNINLCKNEVPDYLTLLRFPSLPMIIIMTKKIIIIIILVTINTDHTSEISSIFFKKAHVFCNWKHYWL